MIRFAAYYSSHYWSQFQLAAYNAGHNLLRVVPVFKPILMVRPQVKIAANSGNYNRQQIS
jgi:soluble lytic murein transglycosylase-like protein